MQKKNIFIVEDNHTTAGILKLYLESFDYNVVGIESTGRQAIDSIEKILPDLVIMDINLGEGIDGIDVANRIGHRYNVPFIFITAYADKNILQRIASVEFVGFINKPLREKDLMTGIQLAFEKIEKKDKSDRVDIDQVNKLLQSTYDLSPAEARVAAELLIHPDLSSAAKTLNISPSTAKKHLHRIFRKTDTNRLTVLVHKIMSGPVGKVLSKK